MKPTALLLSFFALLILSCAKTLTVEPPPTTGLWTAPGFAVGNQYNLHFVDVAGSISTDWYQISSIPFDTIIAGKSYLVFSSGEILRTTNIAVMRWTGPSETSWYPLTGRVGDTAFVLGYKTVITDIWPDSTFGEAQDILEVTNAAFASDTIFDARCSTRFGLVFSRKTLSSQQWMVGVDGVKIGSKTYGTF